MNIHQAEPVQSCKPGDPNNIKDDMRCGSESNRHYCGLWHWHPKELHQCFPCKQTWSGAERDPSGNSEITSTNESLLAPAEGPKMGWGKTQEEMVVIQLLAETGQWVKHEQYDDDTTAHDECAVLNRQYSSAIKFRVARLRVETEVLTAPSSAQPEVNGS